MLKESYRGVGRATGGHVPDRERRGLCLIINVAVSFGSWEFDSVCSETSECVVYGCLLLYVIPYGLYNLIIRLTS